LLGLALHPGFAKNPQVYFAKHGVENGRFCHGIFEREAGGGFKNRFQQALAADSEIR